MSNSNQPNQPNPFNVSRGTLRTQSSYKVEAVKEMLNLRAPIGTVLALLVKHNWDEAQARYDTNVAYNWASDVECPMASSAGVTYLPIEGLNMKLYFAPSVDPSQGIGMHMLIVKNEEPTYVLFIGFYEFSIICQIVAGVGQMQLVKGVDECREVKARQWVMSNVDKLSHRIVTCLFGSDLKELYNLI